MAPQGSDSWAASGFCQPAGGWNIVGWRGHYDALTDTIRGDFTHVVRLTSWPVTIDAIGRM
jgi:hypothetical protein